MFKRELKGQIRKTERRERGVVNTDGEMEKLHFDGAKLNHVCDGGLGTFRQIEAVMSAQRDYCHLCYAMIACCHHLQMRRRGIFFSRCDSNPAYRQGD